MSMVRGFITAAAISFTVGCFVAYFVTLDMLYIACSIIGLSVVVMLLRKSGKAVTLCGCCIVAFLGYIRVALPIKNDSIPLTEQYKKQVHIEGIISGDIEDKNTKSRYVVNVDHINGSVLEKKKAILVYEPYPTECVSGESVSFLAKLSEPEDFMTAAGRVFGYKKYLQQMGIYAVSHIQKSGCTGERKQHVLFERMRKRFVKAMHTFLPAEEATLLGGLLLGLRGTMSAKLMEAFRTTGLIHIVVLSGYNVTLVAETVRRSLARVPINIRFLASLITIVLFVLLAGAQMVAVRAGSMATIALIARTTHREYDGIRALLLVVVAMILYNPNQVLFSVSFHLSFLATLGLLLFGPVIEQKLKKIPKKFEIRGIVSATIATQIFILPYLAYAIGEVPIIGIPSNILILPFIPPAMLFGAMVTSVALIVPSLAIALSPIAHIPLKIIITLTEMLAKIPYATIPLPEISILWVLAVTIMLIIIGYRKTQQHKQGKQGGQGGEKN